MARATGIGGAFLRAQDPQSLYRWYEQHLGLKTQNGCWMFEPAELKAYTVVSFFPRGSEYFPPSQPVMLNFQVDDLDAVLDALIAAGVEVDPKRDRHEYGNFGWFTDPEGNRVELWQPPA
jgi:predicted enzyme related to lactoylglutathione lyase